MQNIAYNLFVILSGALSAAIMTTVLFLTVSDILSL